MFNPNGPLYFSSITYDYIHNDLWDSIYADSSDGGKFVIDAAKKYPPLRLVPRNGEWSLPWDQVIIPGFEMPTYDPNFSKTFEEVTDNRAGWAKGLISQGQKLAIMYSGGIDSTLVMAALIKNLTSEELKSVVVCASIHSIVENPVFWDKFIAGKIQVLDSATYKYDYLLSNGYTPICADTGDSVFGTVMGLGIYVNYDYYIQDFSAESKAHLQSIKNEFSNPEVHFSQYKDIILRHFQLKTSLGFAELFYNKLVHNINTATVPVNSLHDFFWWEIFNTKYLNCAIRGALYYNDSSDWKKSIHSIVDWFANDEYQLWSMVNNNNGQKIIDDITNYKTAARNYIWSVDQNDYYKNFKLKLMSFASIVTWQQITHLPEAQRPTKRVLLTNNYEMKYLDDPGVKDFFIDRLQNYKIDW